VECLFALKVRVCFRDLEMGLLVVIIHVQWRASCYLDQWLDESEKC